MIARLLASTASKVIAGLVFALLAVSLFWWASWDNTAQPKQDARSANATAETAMEAAQVVIDRSDGERSIDDMVNETTKAIENETDPKVAGDLARASICRLLDNRNDPACVVQ